MDAVPLPNANELMTTFDPLLLTIFNSAKTIRPQSCLGQGSFHSALHMWLSLHEELLLIHPV